MDFLSKWFWFQQLLGKRYVLDGSIHCYPRAAKNMSSLVEQRLPLSRGRMLGTTRMPLKKYSKKMQRSFKKSNKSCGRPTPSHLHGCLLSWRRGGGESRSQQSKKQLKVSSSVLWLFQTWVGLVKKCKRRWMWSLSSEHLDERWLIGQASPGLIWLTLGKESLS